ncbi:M28 family peptidase [Thermomicrobiaceae bacterium CFH 74404]|uniref:M28 family peptidase n=1 Tax=Thermalbibacter longus TaxID=2951981 RepID=A0AA42BB44_9BACT|nr:M28 family peptidase [Thermalbibacter longus]MCM8749340.1 M28 family peptidase [Thermalbibacter longus]
MTSTRPFVTWSDPALERELLSQVSLDVPWSIVEQFSRLVRLSGSPDERRAVEILMEHLRSWGVPHTLYEPVCFISIPLEATLRSLEPGGKAYRAKTVSMSVSTGGEEITGELVYVPGAGGTQAGDVFSAGVDLGGRDVRGKIVLTEGMASPGKVNDVMNAGALAGIFINPGTYIHEGICTTIWGAPDLDSMKRQPSIPVLAVNNPDGQELIALAERGGQVALSTRLDTGWRPIPVLVAEIPGRLVPEEFVLLHGHLDSWHVGIGDNATGDATMLELTRVFWQHRDRLARSLRIAWWSGHSHGRYAGSTWYADTFGLELARNCVAQINCDSPGCRWADTYNELTAMSETEPFVDAVIRETTGIVPEPERPPRAGDYSFNQIGITSFYMLSSTMSEEARRERGYYPVGGCGANIQWHTEDDTLEIADRDNLLRDMRMYAASLLRVLNAPIHPFDWTRTTGEFRRTLDRYQAATGDAFSFSPAFEAVDALERALERLYSAVPACAPDSPQARRINAVQRRLARILVPVNYSRMAPFWHDPALNVPPLPDLAPALAMPGAKDDPHRRGILVAHLTRGQNRLLWALEQARELVEAVLG